MRIIEVTAQTCPADSAYGSTHHLVAPVGGGALTCVYCHKTEAQLRNPKG